MARPGNNSATAIVGLVLAAGVFAATLYLNQSHSPSRLIMTVQGDAKIQAVDVENTAQQQRDAR